MELNATTIIIFAVIIIFFFVFYFAKNRKDREELEERIKEDYPKDGSDSTRSEKGTPDYPEI